MGHMTMQKDKLLRAIGALVLLACVITGVVLLRGAGREEPKKPQAAEYPGLNIEALAVRYDASAPELDASLGGGGAATAGSSQQGQSDESGDGTTDESKDDNTPEQPDEPEQTQPDEPEQTTPELPQPTPQPDEKDARQGILIVTGEDDAGWDDGLGDGDSDANGDEPGNGDDAEEPGDGEDGDKSDDEPGDDEMPDDEEKQLAIRTDLANRIISQDTLTDDQFPFYAFIENGEDDMYLRVSIVNANSSGQWLSANGNDYTAKLALGRNQITILLKQGTQTLLSQSFTINYQASRANADDPEKGENPPTVVTNLDGRTEEVKNRNFPLQVTATDYQGKPIVSNHLIVTLDGKQITNYTGNTTMEYQLYLQAGAEGDVEHHIVTVLAWDDNGNSTYREYDLVYRFVDTGDVIGTATVRLDATVLGLGVFEESFSYEIKQDEPASYAVAAYLEAMGYEMTNKGTLDSGFYLSRIGRARAFRGTSIDEHLMRCLEADGLGFSGDGDRNSLGEFDYTSGSGWMYFVNGVCMGYGLSNCFLEDGDVLTLRFTLAYGKDLGLSMSGSQGNLSHYCGTWLDGVYTPHHEYQNGVCAICGETDPNHEHDYVETVLREATCAEAGEKELKCSICGETKTEPIEKLPHTFENGRCTQCGETDPDHVHEYTETVTEPTCTQDGERVFTCVCGDTYSEPIASEGHSYDSENAQYTLSEDALRCTITVLCAKCGESKIIIAEADAGQITVIDELAPTCGEAGYRVYRITVTDEDVHYTKDVRAELPATGEHTYGEDGCCTVCGQRDPDWVEPAPPDPTEPTDPEEPNPGGEDIP